MHRASQHEGQTGGRSTNFLIKGVTVGVLLVLCAAAAYWWWGRRPWTVEEVRHTVVSTIQREAPASFYVTGTLDVTVTSTVQNTEILLPNVLGWELGTATSTVRVPGRIYYGFDVRRLDAEDIRIREDGAVAVRLPELSVYATEPKLTEMEVETDAGWRRFYDLTIDERVERAAIARIQLLLRRQGAAHLRTSVQPRRHTARALKKLLTPALHATGVSDPRFRLRIGGHPVKPPRG